MAALGVQILYFRDSRIMCYTGSPLSLLLHQSPAPILIVHSIRYASLFQSPDLTLCWCPRPEIMRFPNQSRQHPQRVVPPNIYQIMLIYRHMLYHYILLSAFLSFSLPNFG
jgi:hypothetical protein